MNPLDWISMILPENFHFIRSLWLIGIPFSVVLGLLLLTKRGTTRWEELIPKQMLDVLRVSGGKSSTFWKWLIPVCLITGCLAAAGPTWKKIPVPTSTAQNTLVILLDLSPSMLATDISPDRLTRVKYKLIDILRAREDGQTALIAYSGSPHRVAPLTDDIRTIEALLPALHPAMMPSQGSDAESAVELALEMLQATGAKTGDILLITDGVTPEAQRTINNLMTPRYRLSILGVGSTEAVPIPRPEGGYLSDSRGEIVLTELNRNELQILAGFHGGRYVEIQADDSDIRYLLQERDVRPAESEDSLEQLYDSWEDVGYYLVLALIPFAAYAFRRGLIFCLPIVVITPLMLSPQQAQALSWAELWKTPDQQGAEALEAGDPALAAEKFEDPDWASYARYRNQDYAAAGQAINESDETRSALSFYNSGNALALNGELEKAIEAYEHALELEPAMEDAAYNKAIVEQLLQQQEQQEQQDQEQQQNQENESNDSENSDQSQNSDQSESESSDQQEQTGEQSESDQGESEQNQQDSPEQPSDEQEQSESGQEEAEQPPEESPEEESAQSSPEEQQPNEESEEEMATQVTPAEETPEELDPASEQWLRAITDDPSGLLRRKFQHESEVYRREQRYIGGPPGTEEEERY